MVTRTLPPAQTPPIDIRASGTTLTWTQNLGPTSFNRGSVTYTDRAKGEDWRKLIRNGQDATTKATGWKRVWEADKTYLLARNKSTGVYTGQQAYDNTAFTLTTGHYDQAWQLAVGDFIRNARQVQHQFDTGAFLAELRETITFLVAPIRSVRRQSERYYQRIKGRTLWRENQVSKLRKLSDYWLSYRFGVKPLLSDIDDAAHELADLVVGRIPTLPVRGKGKWESATTAVTEGANLSIWRYRRELTDFTKTEVTLRGRVRINMPTQVIYPPSLVRTFETFVPSLWEAIPWSWAADYFTNIGDMLTALTYLESNLAWSNWTARTRVERWEDVKYRHLSANEANWDFFVEKGRNTSTRYYLWDRDTIAPSSLVPKLVLKLPTGSPIKQANLAAAVFQKFSRR